MYENTWTNFILQIFRGCVREDFWRKFAATDRALHDLRPRVLTSAMRDWNRFVAGTKDKRGIAIE